MAYSTIEDIKRFIKWTNFSFSNTLEPNDIKEFIDEADAEIDGRLSKVVNLPISEDEEVDRKLLKYVSIRLASYNIAQILISQAGGDLPATVQNWKEDAERRIEKIIDGEIDLDSAVVKETDYSDALTSGTIGQDKYWKRDEEQW